MASPPCIDTSIVSSIIGLAKGLRLKVIAEGVEREEEYESVKSLGVHLTQGFYFHKPRFMTTQLDRTGS